MEALLLSTLRFELADVTAAQYLPVYVMAALGRLDGCSREMSGSKGTFSPQSRTSTGSSSASSSASSSTSASASAASSDISFFSDASATSEPSDAFVARTARFLVDIALLDGSRLFCELPSKICAAALLLAQVADRVRKLPEDDQLDIAAEDGLRSEAACCIVEECWVSSDHIV
jgi:hypothetical protein